MKKCDAAFQKEILSKCYEHLSSIGYTRYRKEKVDYPINEKFHAWIGLNTGLHSDHLQVNPFVGIHATELMKLYYQLDERKYARDIATYAIHLGELKLSPKERVLSFTPSQSEEFINSEIERLGNLLKIFGLEYSKSIATYEALLPLFYERTGMQGGYPERYTLCLFLLGRKEEAREYAENFVKQQPIHFGVFAKNFLKMIEIHG